MKTTHKQSSKSSAGPQPMPSHDPVPAMEDPFYGHAGWVDPEMKHMVSQEERRGSRHSGRTIKRPAHIGRTMGS